MSDVKDIFDHVRAESRRRAEEALRRLEDSLPRIPGESVFQSDPPKYTDQQRSAYIEQYVQGSIYRLAEYLTDVATGRINTSS